MEPEKLYKGLALRFGGLLRKNIEFACGEGWAAILERLFLDLEKVIPVAIDWHAVQIKEKMGGLRVYYDIKPRDVPDDLRWAIYRLVSLAEARSYDTCEQCGRPGLLRNRTGFFFVSCDRHADEEGETHHRRRAVVVEQYPHYERFADERAWFLYDPDIDDFVPCDPPEGFEGR